MFLIGSDDRREEYFSLYLMINYKELSLTLFNIELTGKWISMFLLVLEYLYTVYGIFYFFVDTILLLLFQAKRNSLNPTMLNSITLTKVPTTKIPKN